MVHQSVLTLLSSVVANLWLRAPVAKRGTIYAAFAMGRIRWPTIRSIDSLAMKHLANANFPHVQTLCLTELMQVRFTTAPFCNIILHKLTIIVPISLISLITMSLRPRT